MVGIDIVAITRIKCLVGKYGESFLRHFLHKSEIKLCKKNTRNLPKSHLGDSKQGNLKELHFNIERIAGFYATKEAISKALGCGISKNLTFHDITLHKDSNGAPQARLTKRTKKHFNIHEIHISISHDNARIRGRDLSDKDLANKNNLDILGKKNHCEGFAIAIAIVKFKKN